MLFGLVLIAINIQPALEQISLYLLLFWERKSMRTLLKKNMIAHRQKNKLTAIIYALSLGCVIFLLTSSNLQFRLLTGSSVNAGADIELQGLCVDAHYAKYE